MQLYIFIFQPTTWFKYYLVFLSLITGFCIIIIHLLTDTFPYDLTIITLIGGLLL